MRLQGKLITQYQQVHSLRGTKFRGGSTLKKHLADIAKLVKEIPTDSILDYGCGRGLQYKKDRMHDAWGGIMPTLFDPGVPGIDKLPDGTFDGVICTGVLEHIPGDEIDGAIDNLVRYARKWAFVSIGCSPSHMTLPNGVNAHVLLRPEEWWIKKLKGAFGEQLRLQIGFVWRKKDAPARQADPAISADASEAEQISW